MREEKLDGVEHCGEGVMRLPRPEKKGKKRTIF
jgi:hypothetical protein